MRAKTVGLSALAFASLALPFVALAQQIIIGASTAGGLRGVLTTVSGLLNGVILLFITIAIVVFFWGLVTYLAKIGGEDAAKKGVQLMLWGIIAIFVMVSVWGLIRILQSTFGITGTEQAIIPSRIIQQ
ncbi:MAG: hypothetical protein AAB899_00850 [Patescibacteria group bacterium]